MAMFYEEKTRKPSFLEETSTPERDFERLLLPRVDDDTASRPSLHISVKTHRRLPLAGPYGQSSAPSKFVQTSTVRILKVDYVSPDRPPFSEKAMTC